MTSPLTSIRVSGDDIEIVNQLLLPHVVEFIPITSIEEAHDAIKSMKIRGAPAIASLAALSLSSYISKALKANPQPPFLSGKDALREHIQPLIDYLNTSRPTAVNLGAAMKRLSDLLKRVVADDSVSVLQAAQLLIEEGRAVADEDVGRNHAMAKLGADWLEVRAKKLGNDEKLNVLTVCNTGSLATSGYGTALGLITNLHETGRLGRAYFTQTAPYHQGSRLTAMELQALKIPSVMICDTMVGSLFQNHKIHGVVVGADRIAKNGDTANKIGTYNAAVLAARHQIPFVVVAPISTVDMAIPDGSHIPIEQRPAIEACLVRGAIYPPPDKDKPSQAVVMFTPPGLDADSIYNPSFDVTPAELITAIVTEKGVATRKEGKEVFSLSSVV